MKLILVLLVALILSIHVLSEASGGPEYPSSMAAMGDSITQAVNPGLLLLGENPQYSWSTGHVFDSIFSHFERIQSINPQMSTNSAFNNAENRARVHDLLTHQLPRTLSQEPDYITIMIGSNDACYGTPLEQFKSDYREALEQLTTRLPDTRILLVGTPDIANLVDVVGDRPYCRWVWETFRVCPELLAEGADTEGFNQRVMEINRAIEDLASEYGPNVRFVSLYEHAFESHHVSSIDCFHPSFSGQAMLADITWENGFYP